MDFRAGGNNVAAAATTAAAKDTMQTNASHAGKLEDPSAHGNPPSSKFSSQRGPRLPLHSTNQHHSLTHNLHNTYNSKAPINNSTWYAPQEHINHTQEHINRRLFVSNHGSFLEDMARRECRNLPCKEHQSIHDIIAYNANHAENDDDGRAEERRRFMLLDFSSDDDVSDSEEDSSTEEDDEGEEDVDGLQEEGNDDNDDGMSDDEEDVDIDDQDLNDEPDDNRLVGEDASVDEDDEVDHSNSLQVLQDSASAQQSTSALANNMDLQERANSVSVHHLLCPSPAITFNPNRNNMQGVTNINHQRITLLLLSLANSEEEPLIRADIPWSVIISCGSPFMNASQNQNEPPHSERLSSPILGGLGSLQTKPSSLLRTLYQQLSDPNGARLLQGVLRMDPPLEAVKVLLDAFPLSCLDMEGFFTACQFAHPNTSLRTREGRHESDGGSRSAPGNTHVSVKSNIAIDDDSDYELDDVGEVVKLVMHQTICARRLNSIDWGMVAFLGDARISPSHAKLLLRHAPEALIDPKHGAFGVSPLDRMASGFFIHGERNAWVEKLRLALRVAVYVRLRQKQLEREEESSSWTTEIVLPGGFFSSDCRLLRRRESSNIDSFDTKPAGSSQSFPAQSFYPYHELIRLIVSPTYQGNKFGQHGFLQTLKACTQSDPDAFLRPDNEGNLAIHAALTSECETVLGVKGERRLIKYLLDLNENLALCPEGSSGTGRKERRLPLRLSVENAWPVHDLIVNSALACCCNGSSNGLPSTNDNEFKKVSSEEFKHGSKIKDYVINNMVWDRPLLHDALNGPYHPRFGIHGARQLVKNIISRITHYHYQHQNRQSDDECQHKLTDFVDINERTALHVALESKWPVYDLIVQANPHCLEAHDPTRHGFFPFQTAACAFIASYPRKSDDTAKEPDEMEIRIASEANVRHVQPSVLDVLDEAGGLRSSDSTKVTVAGSEQEASLMEMSMLFELIRESPLCVTWRMSDESNQSNSRQKADVEGLESAMVGDSSPRRSTKRRRPSSPNK